MGWYNPKLLAQEFFRRDQCGFGFLAGPADNDEVVRPARQPVTSLDHGVIERRQENIRPQRACYSALRNARLGRLPALFRDHSCFKKTSDHLQNAPIANLFGYKINKAVLVNAIK